jgi:hypothetical protein
VLVIVETMIQIASSFVLLQDCFRSPESASAPTRYGGAKGFMGESQAPHWLVSQPNMGARKARIVAQKLHQQHPRVDLWYELDEHTIREELEGNICRCTGRCSRQEQARLDHRRPNVENCRALVLADRVCIAHSTYSPTA